MRPQKEWGNLNFRKRAPDRTKNERNEERKNDFRLFPDITKEEIHVFD